MFYIIIIWVFFPTGHRQCLQWTRGPSEARTGDARSSFGSCLSCSVSSPFMAGLHGPRWPIMCPRNRLDGRSPHLCLQNTSAVFALHLLPVTLLPRRSSLFSCSVTHTPAAVFGACCFLQTARLSSLSAQTTAPLFAQIWGKQKADCHTCKTQQREPLLSLLVSQRNSSTSVQTERSGPRQGEKVYG